MLPKDNNFARAEVTSYAEVLDRYSDRHTVVVAAGATCAYLGDERNLREFLIADEVARNLRRAGHIVHFLLIDDSMDPLNFRQLRVAVNKDPALIEQFTPWCGKPISQLPDPWGQHESFAEHFEEQLLNRLHRLGCHPTLVSTGKLYERGRYAPYVRTVLEQHDEILAYLSQRFPAYQPDKLFWVLCPHCRYIDQTRIIGEHNNNIICHCERCERTEEIEIGAVEGKLNWKLDCAVRWAILGIDIEPFAESYLESTAGSFHVAQELSIRFFGGHQVTPFQYGLVSMERQWSLKLIDGLPPDMLRALMVTRPVSELKISRDLVISLASRHRVAPDLVYLDFVKQMLPMWLLTPEKLTPRQRDLVAHGISFSDSFLDSEMRLHLPAHAHIEGERTEVLQAVHLLLSRTIVLRQEYESREKFEPMLQDFMKTMGSLKGAALQRIRVLVGQQQGLPVARFLFSLPLEYLATIEFLIYLALQSPEHAGESSAQQTNLAA